MRRRVFRWTEGKNPTLVERATSDRSDARLASLGDLRPKFGKAVHVVGVDLSLRAAAACAIPCPWDFDMKKVRMVRAGYALKKDATNRDKIDRGIQIAHDVSVFCVNVKALRVGLEEYAYAAGGANAHQTVECGGMLKADVMNTLDIDVYPVQASSARKILLQKGRLAGDELKKWGDTKKWVEANVRRLGGPALEWTHDEIDAFVVANTVLEHAGATALSFPGV